MTAPTHVLVTLPPGSSGLDPETLLHAINDLVNALTGKTTTAITIVGQLKYTNGTPGANKGLLSDADGNATWTTISVSIVSGAAPLASPTFAGTVTVPFIVSGAANPATTGLVRLANTEGIKSKAAGTGNTVTLLYQDSGDDTVLDADTGKNIRAQKDFKAVANVGFYNTAPQAKQTVTGLKGGNAALGSLLTALATIGLITDSSGV